MITCSSPAGKIAAFAAALMIGIGAPVPASATIAGRVSQPASAVKQTTSSATAGVVAALGAKSPGSQVALAPVRVLNTLSGVGASGAVGAGQSISFTVLGVGGVPASGVSAVALNLTVARPGRAGYLTVYPDGTSRPQTTNLNFAIGQSTANLVVVPVGANGRVRLYNGSGGSVQILADTAAYYVAGAPTAAGTLQTLPARRIMDTRTGLGGARASVLPGTSRVLTISGAGGVPDSGVRAVVLDVAADGATAPGSLTVYPSLSPRPSGSSITFSAGQTRTGLVIAALSSAGQVAIYNGSNKPINAIVDVVGYYRGGNPGVSGALLALDQTAVLDTARGLGAARHPLAANGTLSLQVGGVGNIPGPGTVAVALKVTAANSSGVGYLTVYPSGTTKPATSTLNLTPGSSVSNLVIVPMRSDGKVMLSSFGSSTDLQVDVLGVYLDGTGAARCNLVNPDPAGNNITQWNPIVGCVLSVMGQAVSTSNINDVDTMIQYESSGDPNAINNWDINAQEGHPSEGLIQVIRPTFDAYRSYQLPNDLLNPAANLYAGLNYAVHNYGSIHNVPGLVSLRNGGGYKGYIVAR